MPRQLKSKTVRGVRIEADDLVIGLIDQLIKNERAIESMRKELNDHMEMIAEIQPKLNADGSITVMAMRSDESSSEQVLVTLSGSATQKEVAP